MSQRNDALIADVRRAMKLLNLRKSEVAEQLQMGTTKGQIKRCHAKPQLISFGGPAGWRGRAYLVLLGREAGAEPDWDRQSAHSGHQSTT